MANKKQNSKTDLIGLMTLSIGLLIQMTITIIAFTTTLIMALA